MDVPLVAVKRVLLECSFCEKRFSNQTSLSNHLKTHFMRSEPDGVLCEKCSKVFRNVQYLNRHLQTCSNKYSRKKCFVCGVCGLETVYLDNHYRSQHNIKVEKEQYEFKSMDVFLKWKEDTERTTISRFVRRRGTIVDKQGIRRTYFNCHRGGFFDERRGKNQRQFKATGSNKINGHCPAAIVLKECNGKITGTYIKTHVGHGSDYKRIPLSKREKDLIAKKLVNNVSVSEILTEVKDSISDENVSRIHFINRKDIRNILARHELCKQIPGRRDDSTRDLNVTEYQIEPSSSTYNNHESLEPNIAARHELCNQIPGKSDDSSRDINVTEYQLEPSSSTYNNHKSFKLNIVARHELCNEKPGRSDNSTRDINITEYQLEPPSSTNNNLHSSTTDLYSEIEIKEEEEPLEVVLLDTNPVEAGSLNDLNLLVSKQFGRNVKLTIPKKQTCALNAVNRETLGEERSTLEKSNVNADASVIECELNLGLEYTSGPVKYYEIVDESASSSQVAHSSLRNNSYNLVTESKVLYETIEPGSVVYVQYELAERESLESLRDRAMEQFQSLLQNADSKEKLLIVLDQITRLNNTISNFEVCSSVPFAQNQN